MTDVSSGDGVALDPEVVTITKAEFEALKAKGDAVPVLHDPVVAAHINLANAEAGVERLRGHLAAAEVALVEAQVELAAVLAEHEGV